MATSLLILLAGMGLVLVSILAFRLPAFLALIAAAWLTASITPEAALQSYAKTQDWSSKTSASFVNQLPIKRVVSELSETFGKVGIIIAMASIIGKCLLSSGGADRIVRSALKTIGIRRAPLAFTSSGFLLGIPVFFDTLFYLMIPLAKSLGLREKKHYALFVMSIIAGGTMAHSLIPPTPGPLLVASQLNVPLGWMMLGGLIIGIFTCWVGQIYARWADRKWPLPVRDSGGVTVEELQQQLRADEAKLPPLTMALLPILLPVALIGLQSILLSMAWIPSPETSKWINEGLKFLLLVGEKNTALTLSALTAILLLYRFPGQTKGGMRAPLEEALSQGGLILLITSAGGAFGGVLQHTGIAEQIQQWASGYQLALLPLAFFVTTLIRTAQGSATVAMITTVGIFSGMADSGDLAFHPLYLALAIGCGSKPFPWMNDSGFWIIGRMSGMKEHETFRYFSFMISLMGLAGLLAIVMAAFIIPLK
ncbi:MAG: GntP family permease [Verrucomicrobiota bacterium]|jgi:gluconate:H+ symporter, GntP family|nr:GntP family permease [Verrucomicrobiota bacterium]